MTRLLKKVVNEFSRTFAEDKKQLTFFLQSKIVLAVSPN